MSFVGAGSASKPDYKIQKEAEDQERFWFPVAMNAATREEVKWATRSQLDLYNEIAIRIFKLKYGQGETADE